MKTLLLTLISLLALNSYAQIITYTTNDTVQVDIPNDPNKAYYLDFNQDGINDMVLQQSFGSNSGCFLSGITDSSDVLHELFYFGVPGNSISGHHVINMTDSIISDNSDWMVILQTSPSASSGGGLVYSTFINYVSSLLNQNFYLGVRFFVEGSDFISRPHYGCLDATLTQNKVFILHGWSYEAQPNTPITCTDSLLIDVTGIEENSNSPKQLIKITDLMGRETTYKPNTILIYVYDDGTSERVFKLEE